MTDAELVTALKALGMPVTQGRPIDTPENPAPALPFITLRYVNSADLMADNQNAIEAGYRHVELYTKKKDPVSEKKMQDLLKSLSLPYLKLEAYIEAEKLRQIIYEINF